MAVLSHPNIVAIHDVASGAGRVYAVMDLLNGESLGERLRHGPMDCKQALKIGVAVADGLAVTHSKGIVHRDIYPGDIFLTEGGAARILNFRLSAPEEGEMY